MSMLATPHEGPTTGEPAPPGFQQRLGLFDATMLVAGSMIGSGIFIVSAEIARDVGASGWLLVVWLLAGVMTIIGALSYAELAAMMPHAGGQYVYLREAYSPLWGFLYGWTLFLVIQTGTIAAVAVTFAKFLGVIVPALGTKPEAGAWVFAIGPWCISAGQGLAVGIIAFLTLLNCLGVQRGKWVQNIFTVAKTLALILLIVLGLTVAANSQVIRANTADWWADITHTEQFQFKTARSVWSTEPVADSAGQLLLYGELAKHLSDGKPLRLGFAVLTKSKFPDLTIHPVVADPRQVERTKRVVEQDCRAIEAGHFYPAPSATSKSS